MIWKYFKSEAVEAGKKKGKRFLHFVPEQSSTKHPREMYDDEMTTIQLYY